MAEINDLCAIAPMKLRPEMKYAENCTTAAIGSASRTRPETHRPPPGATKFATSRSALSGAPSADRFGELEKTQGSLLAELSAERAMSGMTPSSPTPSADAIRAELKPDIEAEISKVIRVEAVAEK